MTIDGIRLDRRLPGAAASRRTQRVVLAEQLDAIVHELQTNTAALSKLHGQVQNGVLEMATYVIPAAGYVTSQYKAPMGSIEIENFGANPMRFAAEQPAGGAAPVVGVGRRKIASNTHRVLAAVTHVWTIYGTAGDEVAIQAFTAGPSPSIGGMT